jgi:thiamine pyrophosphokinase
VIVAGGDVEESDIARVPDAELVIAADAGAVALERRGLVPDLLVGDLDSVEAATVERLVARGTRVERHPPDKDASDAELALQRAIEAGAGEILLLGLLGGERLDHELAGLLLLADPDWASLELEVARGGTLVRSLRGPGWVELRGTVGDWVSLLPIGGDAVGVRTSGLRWALTDETLSLGRSRGLSNEIVAQPASVRLTNGLLVVVETQRKEGNT